MRRSVRRWRVRQEGRCGERSQEPRQGRATSDQARTSADFEGSERSRDKEKQGGITGCIDSFLEERQRVDVRRSSPSPCSRHPRQHAASRPRLLSRFRFGQISHPSLAAPAADAPLGKRPRVQHSSPASPTSFGFGRVDETCRAASRGAQIHSPSFWTTQLVVRSFVLDRRPRARIGALATSL